MTLTESQLQYKADTARVQAMTEFFMNYFLDSEQRNELFEVLIFARDSEATVELHGRKYRLLRVNDKFRMERPIGDDTGLESLITAFNRLMEEHNTLA